MTCARLSNGECFMRAQRDPYLSPMGLFDASYLTKRKMTMAADGFKLYRKKQLTELRPYVEGEDMAGISVSDQDAGAGSPKAGDMIARDPSNEADRWLVSAAFFNKNYEPF